MRSLFFSLLLNSFQLLQFSLNIFGWQLWFLLVGLSALTQTRGPFLHLITVVYRNQNVF